MQKQINLLKQQQEKLPPELDKLSEKQKELLNQWIPFFQEREELQEQIDPLQKYQEELEQEWNPFSKSQEKLEQKLKLLQSILNSKNISIDDKISKIIEIGYTTGSLMTKFENYCKDKCDKKISFSKSTYSVAINVFGNKIMEEQYREKEEDFKEIREFESKLNDMETKLKDNKIMEDRLKEINDEILLYNFNFTMNIDELVGNTKILLELVGKLVESFEKSKDYRHAISKNKRLFKKIIKQIRNFSTYSTNIEEQLNDYVFDMIVDKYIEICTEEGLTLDNVYEKGEYIGEFKEIAKIFLDDEKTLEEYCEKRKKRETEKQVNRENEKKKEVKEVKEEKKEEKKQEMQSKTTDNVIGKLKNGNAIKISKCKKNKEKTII